MFNAIKIKVRRAKFAWIIFWIIIIAMIISNVYLLYKVNNLEAEMNTFPIIIGSDLSQ